MLENMKGYCEHDIESLLVGFFVSDTIAQSEPWPPHSQGF